VIGVIIFIVIAVVIGLAVFFISGQARSRSRGTALVYLAIYLVFGAAIPALILNGNQAHASKQIGGVQLTAGEKTGRELFSGNCATCHTLAAANAVGKVGPNLDVLRPPAFLVLNTIQNGCLQTAPLGTPQGCLGYGNMPSEVLQGKQAAEVAAFVAVAAGRR
jgi:mono/diheme cytochrome c family protein